MKPLPFVPRLLKAPLAGAYLGMSETKFRELVEHGRIAEPLRADGLVRWDVRDLDAYADGLHDPTADAIDPRPVRAI
ncbi:MAG: hypothetical protein AAGJ29_12335 [Pseudomonadota bacterium]